MKPAHKLLFVLCPMLVLGFIYYSSGKLRLPVWGQKPRPESGKLRDSKVNEIWDQIHKHSHYDKDVTPTVKVSKVTKNTVKSPETKEPVVEGPVSVGRTVGSGTACKECTLVNMRTLAVIVGGLVV